MSDSATPWTVARQAPLSMEFFRQEYWSGMPFPSPGDLPNPRFEPWSLALQADSLPSEPPGKPQVTIRSDKSLSRVQLFATPWTVALLCRWNSLGKNTGVGCHSLLQGIFPTQGSTPGLMHCRRILHHLSHQRSPVNSVKYTIA